MICARRNFSLHYIINLKKFPDGPYCLFVRQNRHFASELCLISFWEADRNRSTELIMAVSKPNTLTWDAVRGRQRSQSLKAFSKSLDHIFNVIMKPFTVFTDSRLPDKKKKKNVSEYCPRSGVWSLIQFISLMWKFWVVNAAETTHQVIFSSLYSSKQGQTVLSFKNIQPEAFILDLGNGSFTKYYWLKVHLCLLAPSDTSHDLHHVSSHDPGSSGERRSWTKYTGRVGGRIILLKN